MLVHFMQENNLLPKLKDSDLDILIEYQLEKLNSNFHEKIVERNLKKIYENQGEFNRSKDDCFRLIKLDPHILE